MAILVTHREKGGRFILVGSGFGAFKATRPSLVFGNLSPREVDGTVPVVLLCDHTGTIAWVHSKDVRVLEVDGLAPGELLSDRIDEADLREQSDGIEGTPD